MKLNTITLIVAVLCLSACRKFVEIPAPEEQTPTEKVYQLNETANAAGLGLYTSAEQLMYDITFSSGLAGDELTNFSEAEQLKELYSNALNSTDAFTNDIWIRAYNQIYMANSVYEGCTASTSISTAVKRQCIGEALFFRALWHFYLVNLYGDIPVITNTDYLINSKAGKATKADVFKRIMADLKLAIKNLNTNYTTADAVTTNTERTRVNKNVAIALLARVSLYAGNYAEAETNATSIISDIENYNLIDLKLVFLKTSKEAIFQLKAMPSFGNSINGFYFILTGAPVVTSIANCTTISPQLLNSFETDDLRKANWIGKSSSDGDDYFFPYKYKIKDGTNAEEYAVVLRLAEQYLIRAEARARRDNLGGAIADVDEIRKRAGLPLIANIIPTIGKDDLINAIHKERRLELFTEFGDRWVDLKRTEKVNAVMTVVTPEKMGEWATYKQLWPIPIKDVQNNPNISQNQGYN